MGNDKPDRFPVVTLCGSTKFYDDFMIAQRELSAEGNVVLSCSIYHHSKDKDYWEFLSDNRKAELYELLKMEHFQRIDMSDVIFVVNPGGYIGELTATEIEYARAAGKGIMYMYGRDGVSVFHCNSRQNCLVYPRSVPTEKGGEFNSRMAGDD